MSRPVHYTDYAEFKGSSAIGEAYYDALKKHLYVAFHSGSVAGYENVPPGVWHNLTNASSAGQYYTYNIRNHFKGLDTRDIYFLSANATGDPSQYQTTAAFATGNTGSPAAAKSANTSQKWVVRVKVDATLEVPVDGADFNEAVQNAQSVIDQLVTDGSSYVEGVNKA